MRADWMLLIGSCLGLAGCHLMGGSSALPTGSELVRDQLIIHSDFALEHDHPLLSELAAQRADLAERLQVPLLEQPIHVYLFEDAKRYRRYMKEHHPDFPERRAFFMRDERGLAVYAHWGDRIAEDLRHEVTHGYLHASVPDLPIWLDEGLAEYYEVGIDSAGVHDSHIDLLLERWSDGSWQPDLTRLEKAQTMGQLQQIDYAEAWLWTHWMLQSKIAQERWISSYLADMRHGEQPLPLSIQIAQAVPRSESALIAHLHQLSSRQHR